MTRHDMAQQFCQPISFNSFQFKLTRRRLMWFSFSFAHFDNMILQIYPALASWSQYNDISQCRGGKRRPCVNLMHRCDQTKFTYFIYLHTCTDVILTYFTYLQRSDIHIVHKLAQMWPDLRAYSARAGSGSLMVNCSAGDRRPRENSNFQCGELFSSSQYIFISSFK